MDFISVYQGVRQQHASEHDPVYCVIQHPRDQPYYAIMSVHVHYLRKKKQINGLSFDSVFLCGTFGMSIKAKYLAKQNSANGSC